MDNIVSFVPRNTERNVVSFSSHGNLAHALSQHGENPNIFFPVEMFPLNTLTCVKDVGLHAVVRTDTNTILAVHGKRYNLITNYEVYRDVENAIKRVKGLDTEGVIIQDSLTNAGGKTIRSYLFPKHVVKVGQSDETLLRVSVINSYDGSCNFQILVGGFRIVCANGMVVGDTLGKYSNRHTSGYSTEVMQHRITAALEAFLAAGEKWKRWAKTPVTAADAVKHLEALAGESNALLRTLMGYWDEERAKLGSNLWALFNAMTYWSTHQSVKNSSADNKPAIILEREKRVGTILNSSSVFLVA